MAAPSSSGIQTLLEAEKEAAKIVQKARQYRVDKLKAARTEAIKEIEKLKEAKNEEFLELEAEHSGTSDQSVTRLQNETEAKLSTIQTAFGTNKAKVVDKLLEAVTRVEAKTHENLRV